MQSFPRPLEEIEVLRSEHENIGLKAEKTLVSFLGNLIVISFLQVNAGYKCFGYYN